jgi:hypothetical protein
MKVANGDCRSHDVDVLVAGRLPGALDRRLDSVHERELAALAEALAGPSSGPVM